MATGKRSCRHSMAVMAVAGASTVLHCWRYDAVKIKSLELIETKYKESDMDLTGALALAKSELKAWRIFNVLLALVIAFQVYFFIRGAADKKRTALSETDRQSLKPVFEAHMRYWAWLGPGHHNTLLLIGIALSPWTLWGFWAAFLLITVPMNVAFVVGEIRFFGDYKRAKERYSV